MASALIIEEETGTTRAGRHPHNGYYAGDFGSRPVLATSPLPVPSTPSLAGIVRLAA